MSFSGLISTKFRNYDVGYQERLTRSSKIFPWVGAFLPRAVLLQKSLQRGRAFDYLKKFPRGFARGNVGAWN